jgi:hypothetical protein
MCFAGLLFGAPRAEATVHVDYELYHPCCNNDSLWGTHASIKTPSSAISLPADECISFLSDAEGHRSGEPIFSRLISTGFLRCGNDTNVAGTCATVNKQIQFVVIIDALGYHCYSEGAIGASINAKYGVRRASGTSNWSAWIDGVQDTHVVTFGNTDFLYEGMEYRGLCGDSVNVPAVTFGTTTVWQRLNENGWVTVNSSYTTGDLCGYTLNGGPSGQWSITR